MFLCVGGETELKILKTDRGVILNVYVKPNSKKFKIIADNNEFVVFCRESPEKGNVNKELIKELSRLFHKKVEIAAGFTSKQKKILVKDITEGEIIKHIKHAEVTLEHRTGNDIDYITNIDWKTQINDDTYVKSGRCQ